MTKKILITGASGLVGTQLTKTLLSKNYAVVHLGRTKRAGNVPSFAWNIEKKEIDLQAFENVDTVVHLAGANVGDGRWTTARKKEILDSRVQSTKLLFNFLKNNKHSVKSFIAASAIGYYGFEGNQVFDEESGSGGDFLANITKQWEDEVNEISSIGVRVAKIRIGIVLSTRGGALQQMTRPIKYGFGAPLGSGHQYLSWIHMDDLCEVIRKAIEDDKMTGAYNAAAAWATNKQMTETIAKILKRPLWLPNVPSFILKIILGEMADIVVNGSKVSSKKLEQAGFKFRFLNLEETLHDIFEK